MTDTDSFQHGGFTFSYVSGTIGQHAQLEELADVIGSSRVPLPEETYPNNSLSIKHDASGATLTFDCRGALQTWHEAQSSDSRFTKADGSGCDVTSFDWRYNVGLYDGQFDQPGGGKPHSAAHLLSKQRWELPCGAESLETAAADGSVPKLPLHKLRRTDSPILFYASFPLYADELHDRGRTEAVVKLRVMSDCFLALCRLYTRVDGLSVHLRDVRWYGDLPQNDMPARMLCDTQVRDCDMATVRSALGLPAVQYISPMLAADRAVAAARAACALPPWMATGSTHQPIMPVIDETAEHSSDAGPAGFLGLEISADQVFGALQPTSACITQVDIIIPACSEVAPA